MGGIDASQVPECVLDTALRGLYWYTIAYLDHDNEMPVRVCTTNLPVAVNVI